MVGNGWLGKPHWSGQIADARLALGTGGDQGQKHHPGGVTEHLENSCNPFSVRWGNSLHCQRLTAGGVGRGETRGRYVHAFILLLTLTHVDMSCSMGRIEIRRWEM